MKTFTQILAIWALLVCLADLCCTKDFVTWGTKDICGLTSNISNNADDQLYKASAAV